MSTVARTWCVGLCALSVCACDLLAPPASPPPATRIALGDDALAVITQTELPCEERLQGMADLLPCDAAKTAHGREARCPLEPPLKTLSFGCGAKPEISPRPRLRLVAESGADLRQRVEARLGPCVMQLLGPLAGGEPRWTGDRGLAVCFFPASADGSALGSTFRTFPGGDRRFPAGLYLEYAPELLTDEELARLRTDGPAAVGLEPTALVLETELVGKTARTHLEQALPTLLGL